MVGKVSKDSPVPSSPRLNGSHAERAEFLEVAACGAKAVAEAARAAAARATESLAMVNSVGFQSVVDV